MAQVVQQGGLDGDPHRVVQGQFQDTEPQFNPFGLDRQRAGEDQRVAIDTFAGEVMLSEPNGIESQLLNQFSLRQTLLNSLRVAGVVKFHWIEKVTEAHYDS